VSELLDGWDGTMADGVSLDKRDPDGQTALCLAVWSRACGAVVRRLVAAGADVRARDEYGRSALSRATEFGDAGVLAALLSVDSTTDLAASMGLSELHGAALRGSAAEIRKLLAAGANAGARDKWGMTALMWGACSGDEATVGALLESRDAGVDAMSKDGQTAVHIAAVEGRASVVGRLLSAGADAALRGASRRTLLMYAASSGDIDTVDLVLSSGKAVGVDALDVGETTALSYAAGLGHVSVVRRLLAAGADAGLRSRKGHTALMSAAKARHADAMTVLLSSGRCGDLEARDDEGRTALTMAACRAKLSPCVEGLAAEDAVSVLLDWGADLRSPADFLATGYGLNCKIASPAVAGLLRSRQVWIRRRRLVLWRRGLAPL